MIDQYILKKIRKAEIVKPESEVPKSKVPKSRPKGLGMTLKSHGITTHPYLLSMKEFSGKKVLIVKVAQNDPLDSSNQKIDQVDSEIKDVG